MPFPLVIDRHFLSAICPRLYGIAVGLAVLVLFVGASLLTMSIGTRIVGAITFQQVDHAPHAEARADSDNQNFQGVDSRSKKFHIVFLHSKCLLLWGKRPGYEKSRPFQAAGTSGQLGPRSGEGVRVVQIVIVENVVVQTVRVPGLVNLVFLVGIEFQPGAYQLFQMESVALLVRLRRVFIVRVLFQVILGREKRAQAPEL